MKRNYSNISVETTLVTGIDSLTTSLTVADDTGYPAAPFVIRIDPDLLSEELMLVGARSGTIFSSITRGFGGTLSSSHSAGAVIEHVAVAEDYRLIFDHIHTGAGGDDTELISHNDLITITPDQHHTEDHADRHVRGGLDELITTLDNSVEVGAVGLTGSFTTIASVNLSIPATWNEWKCYATATGIYDEPVAHFRIMIDGVAQNEGGPLTAGNLSNHWAVGGRRTGITTTGSRTIAVQGRSSGAGADADFIFLYAQATRTG